VITARSAAEAVDAVAAAPRLPDISIIDYHLDAGDGVSAAAELRARFDPDLVAILITADRSPAVKSAAARAGMPILHKPVRPASLRAMLARSRASRNVAAE
jgi:CheY-like chemotaxis protein